MGLPFFKDQPLERKCSVVKTVQESAEEVASELGIAPPNKINDVALKFVGENGLPPKDEKEQEAYFGELWGKVSPLIPETAEKRTKDDLRRTVLAKVQEESQPKSPPSAPSGNSTGNSVQPQNPIVNNKPPVVPGPTQDKPRAEPEVSARPKPGEPERANLAPSIPTGPAPADSSIPNSSVLPRALSNAQSPSPQTAAAQALSESVRRDFLDLGMTTKNSPQSSPRISTDPSLRETGLVAINNPTMFPPTRHPVPLSPEILKFKEPILENGITPKTDLRKEYLDLAANSLKPQQEWQKGGGPTPTKTKSDEKTSPLPQLPFPERKELMKAESKLSEPIIPKAPLGVFPVATLIPYQPNDKGLLSKTPNENGAKIKPEESDNKNNFPNLMTAGLASSTNPSATNTIALKQGSESAPSLKKVQSSEKLAERLNQPIKNIFSDFVGFAKNQLSQSDFTSRDISSVTNREIKQKVAQISQQGSSEKLSYLPWLTFFAGSVGTLCFLIGLSMHLRKRRLKSSSLALVPRRIKPLN